LGYPRSDMVYFVVLRSMVKATRSISAFLTCVSHTAHVRPIDIGWTSVRLSVCLSVRHMILCQNGSIVKRSSLPGSPIILFFLGPNFFPEFQLEVEYRQRGR